MRANSRQPCTCTSAPRWSRHDKTGEREAPSTLNEFIYDDLFGSGSVHLVNRWSRITETGVEGDPMLATPEKGKAFAELEIANLVKVCQAMRAMKPGPSGTSIIVRSATMRLSRAVYLMASGRAGCFLTHSADCNAYAIDCGGIFVD